MLIIVELSYVKVDTAYEGGAWNFQHYGCVHITNCNHIDILHNDLNYVVSSGIVVFNTNYINIQFNNIYTGRINNYYSNDGIYISAPDDGNNYGNLNISHNRIIMQNSWHQKIPEPPHTDCIQLNNIQLLGGTSSIYDNFICVNPDITPYQGSGIYLESGLNGNRGHWNIYNNIISLINASSGIGAFSIEKVKVSPIPLSVEFYNNTIYSSKENSISFFNVDSLWFKNNIIIKPKESAIFINNKTASGYLDFDYNWYYLQGYRSCSFIL